MDRSDFLFASPSFIAGVSRALDLAATLSGHSYNTSSSPAEADLRASTSDWSVVGNDMDAAVDAYENDKSGEAAA